MNIKYIELADALVLTTSDIKIICCSECCIGDKMLQSRKGMYREQAASRSLARLRN